MGIKKYLHGVLSNLIFLALIPGVLPLKVAVFCFAVFAMLDRIYSMSIVISIPILFGQCQNKSVMDSLITLSSWLALTIVSWIEGKYLDVIGITCIEIFLCITLAGGSAINYYIKWAGTLLLSVVYRGRYGWKNIQFIEGNLQ